MSSIMTNSRSVRCLENETGDKCFCRYKIDTCEAGSTTVIFQQGTHVMDDLPAPSPARPRLTADMKDLIEAELERHPVATAQ
jgi:hypothetical protein